MLSHISKKKNVKACYSKCGPHTAVALASHESWLKMENKKPYPRPSASESVFQLAL